MPHLSFADLINRRIPLDASEAAALTLGVARVMDARRAAGQDVRLPADEWILLNSDGEVSIVEVYSSADTDDTTSLSALLSRLLQLESIDVSPIGPAVFRAALEKSASSEPTELAAVFWRAASSRPERQLPRPSGENLISTGIGADRRQLGMSRTDLRRALRDVEGELFELRSRYALSRTTVVRSPRRLHRAAVASVLGVAFTTIIAVAGLALVGAGTSNSTASVADTSTTRRVADIRLERPVGQPTKSAVKRSQKNSGELTGISDDRAERRSSRSATVSRARHDKVHRAQPKRPHPLATLRGGMRGIPFALPPG